MEPDMRMGPKPHFVPAEYSMLMVCAMGLMPCEQILYTHMTARSAQNECARSKQKAAAPVSRKESARIFRFRRARSPA